MLETVLIIVLAALIGYVTNWLAVKMLFYPQKQWYIADCRIPLTPGLIPKYYLEITNRIIVILKDVINSDDLYNGLRNNTSLYNQIKDNIQEVLKDYYVPAFIRREYASNLTDHIFATGLSDITGHLDIGSLLKVHLDNLDMKTLEKTVNQITRNALKYIQRLGLVVGAFIGLLQSLL